MNVYCPAFSFFCLDNSWVSRVKLKTVENRFSLGYPCSAPDINRIVSRIISSIGCLRPFSTQRR